MTQRRLHIAAYDIRDDDRRRAAHRIIRGYASGRQKSVFECPLTGAERDALVAAASGAIDPDEDRLVVVRLDPRGLVLGLGLGVPLSDPQTLYFG